MVVAMVLCVANFLLVFLEKSIEPRKKLDSKFGLEDRPDVKSLGSEKGFANGAGSQTVGVSEQPQCCVLK